MKGLFGGQISNYCYYSCYVFIFESFILKKYRLKHLQMK